MSQLIEDLFDEIHKRRLSVSKFARDVAIPVERIYQWKKGNGKPKSEDAEKIKKWLKNPEEITIAEKSLEDRLNALTETVNHNKALINLLAIELMEIKAGLQISKYLSDAKFEKDAHIALDQVKKES